MKKLFLLTSFLILFSISLFSQYLGNNGDGYTNGQLSSITLNNNFSLTVLYNGNNGDGYSDEILTSTTLNNLSLAIMYRGGNGNGYTKKDISSTTLDNLSLAVMYNGSNSDGYTNKMVSSTTLNNLSLTLIYSGGNEDGYANKTLTSTTLNNLSLAIMYNGSNGDGYTNKILTSTTLNNLSLAIMYNGSNGDGYSDEILTSTTLNNLSLAIMYNGSNGDGYSDEILTPTTLNNLPLVFLYQGGDGDGFAKNEYLQNPLCDRIVTIWNNGTWSNGHPTNISQVVIADNYDTSIDGNLIACSCSIKEGNTLIIRENNFTRVVNDIVNNGAIDIMHQGSLVQNNNDATVTGNGNFTTRVETTLLIDQDRFTYFSSPSQNQDLNVFNSFANTNRLWRFNEISQNWYRVNQNDTMIPAVGYAIQGAPDTGQYPLIGFANFQGAFNNGILSYPLTYNPGGIDDDNSLVGNPYPSAINATLLLNHNPNANAFYFWTHNSELLSNGYAGDDYAIWNNSGGIASASGSPAPSGFIASGQGFFVDAIGPGDLIFNNSFRVTDNNTDFRNNPSTSRDRIWLNLSHESGLFNQLLINFSEQGTLNFDPKFDAVRFNTLNPISFNSIGLNEELLAIQALPILSQETIVPLSYNITNDYVEQLKISIDNIENFNNIEIYLRDNLLNIIHDLEWSDYIFNPIISNSPNINYNNRFELIFKREALDLNENINSPEYLIVSNLNNDKILVKTKNGSFIKSFIAFDALGKTIINQNPNQNNFNIQTNLKSGTVLFIKAKLVNGKVLNTKFIKL